MCAPRPDSLQYLYINMGRVILTIYLSSGTHVALARRLAPQALRPRIFPYADIILPTAAGTPRYTFSAF